MASFFPKHVFSYGFWATDILSDEDVSKVMDFIQSLIPRGADSCVSVWRDDKNDHTLYAVDEQIFSDPMFTNAIHEGLK